MWKAGPGSSAERRMMPMLQGGRFDDAGMAFHHTVIPTTPLHRHPGTPCTVIPISHHPVIPAQAGIQGSRGWFQRHMVVFETWDFALQATSFSLLVQRK